MRHGPEVALVLYEVAGKHEVTIAEMTGKSSLREFTEARVAAAQELYQLGLTAREIGKILNRSRDSIFHYLRKRWTP